MWLEEKVWKAEECCGAWPQNSSLKTNHHGTPVRPDPPVLPAPLNPRLAPLPLSQTARVWDLDTLRLLHTLPHPDPVLFVSFLGPDTLLTATTGAGYVWRAGRLLRRMADDNLRAGCATAWDVHLATGMGEHPRGWLLMVGLV